MRCKEAEEDEENSSSRLDELYNEFETDLTLIGSTVVEDRLSDEVPETIAALHQAIIKIWMLTGDKLETAESIGYSSKLLNSHTDIVRCRT